MKKLMMILFASITVFAMAQTPKSGGQPGKPRQQHTPEQRATAVSTNLTQQLVLNEKQQKQIHDLVLDKATKIKSIRDKYTTDRQAAHAEIQPIRKDFDVQMKTILTDAQFTKWQQIKAERKAKFEAQRQAQQKQKATPPPPAPESNDDVD